MSRTKLRLLAGVCSLLTTAGFAAAASAQNSGSTATINGGGSTLLAPYWNQAAWCYDSVNSDYYVPGTTSPFAPQVATKTTTHPTCSHQTTNANAINLDATGSGAGVAGVFAHDATPGTPYTSGVLTSASTILFGSTDSLGTDTAEPYASIQYGLSDNSLVDADVGVYQVGTNATYNPPHGRSSFTTASSYQGLTFSGASAHVVGSSAYPVASGSYGAMVQFPVSVDPVVLAYNPKYTSTGNGTFSLRIKAALQNTDGSGGLHLDSEAYCKIFTGQITDWGDAYLTQLNGGTKLLATTDPNQGATGHPISLVGRSDSSGTSSIFTRHMAAVCGSNGSGGGWTTAFGNAGVTKISTLSLSGSWTLSQGSGGVASSINSAPGSIGYIGPDYALPAVTNTGANSFGLNVADLRVKVSTGSTDTTGFVEPTHATAFNAFSSIAPPQSNSATDGTYNASNTANGFRDDPTAWVQSTSWSATLAQPQTSGSTTIYPLVGTTNLVAYTCYASSNSTTLLVNFLNWAGPNAKTILNNAGLGELPTAWQTAISDTFLNSSDPNSLKLFFATAGSGSANSNCTSVTGA